MKETYLSNIDLSSEIIVFDKQSNQGQLTITNKHDSLGVVFKIKATKLNIIEVKPAKGFIGPQSKVVIVFKLSVSMVNLIEIQSQQQMQATQNSDKFLIQFLNIVNRQASRQQVEGYWKAYKNNTANLEKGYGCYRVFMNLTGKKLAISNVRSDTMNSKMYKTAMKQSKAMTVNEQGMNSEKANQLTDEQLSKKYTDLKQKQQQLKHRRQNIFKGQTKKVGSNGSKLKFIIIFLILFAFSFLSGNYLRSSMIKTKHHQKIKQQKKCFLNLPYFC